MEEPEEQQTFKEKLLFYITAFFVLLGTFSLFAFLFLVPFVIDPAFTTIFMQFDLKPAECMTSEVIMKRGTKNCTWASCREGCTKEVYNCTQIRVNYKVQLPDPPDPTLADVDATSPYPNTWESSTINEWSVKVSSKIKPTYYDTSPIEWSPDWIDRTSPHKLSRRDNDDDDLLPSSTPQLPQTSTTSTSTSSYANESEWYFIGAKLFPNVKGCGYPPMLNCSIFLWKYQNVGTNFSCYYSKIDPALVMSDLDMKQVYINLILATAIPIPSFIISVIYLAFAYFVIYAEEPVDPESSVPVEGGGVGGEGVEGEDGDKEALGLVIGEEGNQDEAPTEIIAGENEQEADELPDKAPEPSPENPVIPPPSGDLIKPAAMMVVRPSTLQPSGPIAAV